MNASSWIEQTDDINLLASGVERNRGAIDCKSSNLANRQQRSDYMGYRKAYAWGDRGPLDGGRANLMVIGSGRCMGDNARGPYGMEVRSFPALLIGGEWYSYLAKRLQ